MLAASVMLPRRTRSRVPQLSIQNLARGGAWGTTDPTVNDLPPDGFFASANVPGVVGAGSQGFNNSGALAGGQIGYLQQSGAAVFGVEAAFDWTNLKGSGATPFQTYRNNAPFGFTRNQEGKSDFLLTLLGRASPNMGSWYPYITAGVAVAHLKFTSTYNETFYPSVSTASFSKDAIGLAVVGGGEWKVAPHWLVRGEYLYMDFSKVTGSTVLTCGGGTNPCNPAANFTTLAYGAKFKENLARIALSYQW
jgi:outer membrane immunogenic protein